MSKRGRPRKFDDPEVMQGKILEYFANCPDERVYIANGVQLKVPCPTVSGLAIYLGFADRYSFYEYEKHPDFTYTIKKARSFIERHYEQLLQAGNSTGAIFALKNFGWQDTPLVDQSTHNHFTIIRADENKTEEVSGQLRLQRS